MAADLDRFVQRWADDLRARGFIVRWHSDQDIYRDAIRWGFDLPNGRRWNCEITSHEVRMGGAEAIRHWMRTTERAIEHEGRRPDPRAIAEPPRYTDALRGYAGLRPEWFLGDWEPKRDSKAEKRAAELFRLAVGVEPFNVLDSGRGLPITGSKGTPYTLHKRASYCVERPKDGAKLCVVVPGVPLWDHLLGVKLMVEHDEPRFLKTANVAGGAGWLAY